MEEEEVDEHPQDDPFHHGFGGGGSDEDDELLFRAAGGADDGSDEEVDMDVDDGSFLLSHPYIIPALVAHCPPESSQELHSLHPLSSALTEFTSLPLHLADAPPPKPQHRIPLDPFNSPRKPKASGGKSLLLLSQASKFRKKSSHLLRAKVDRVLGEANPRRAENACR